MRPMDEVLASSGEFFMKRSPVHRAARRMAQRLDELGIPYVIAGALAVNAHGHARNTVDVDVLLTRAGLDAFKQRWLGRGWVEKFPGSKGLRDAEDNVTIDVLLTGEFPGDGRPKPVVFPDPAAVAEASPDGYRVLPLRALLELKLASGMSAPHRLQDLADGIALIRVNSLPLDYAIDPYVADKYRELWQLAQIRDEE